jgi:hypothetical protein
LRYRELVQKALQLERSRAPRVDRYNV